MYAAYRTKKEPERQFRTVEELIDALKKAEGRKYYDLVGLCLEASVNLTSAIETIKLHEEAAKRIDGNIHLLEEENRRLMTCLTEKAALSSEPQKIIVKYVFSPDKEIVRLIEDNKRLRALVKEVAMFRTNQRDDILTFCGLPIDEAINIVLAHSKGVKEDAT